ncbi:MAG: peptidylprolyl isomerase [Rhodospirillaceae bacterium]|nr:peptidylprolyl isomerase [Rhodospirillaceae bacterium]|tara:strand:- start:166 stop:768 length:603 start_codon:yes stop_codon:yes gene_type:complete
MKLFHWRNRAVLLFAFAAFAFQTLTLRAATLENTIYLDLKDGRVVIELWPDVAPKHVERIKTLARQKFYDGIVFHRVIDGFMAQTGDPTGTGMGGSSLPDLPAEFNSAFHVEGTLSMARSSSPDSANSQFFICFAPAPFLDGQYTAWGKVVEGMELVHRIKKGDSNQNGSVDNPDKIIQMRVAADVEKKSKPKVEPKAIK